MTATTVRRISQRFPTGPPLTQGLTAAFSHRHEKLKLRVDLWLDIDTTFSSFSYLNQRTNHQSTHPLPIETGAHLILEMAEQVQVFGFWESAFSRRVEVALKLKGIKYQYFEEDLPDNKSDLLLKYNPIHKKVPVLVHHGKPIAESLVILEYIDEIWKNNPILPQHPHQRALARFWAKFIDDKVVVAVVKAAGSKEEEERKKAIEEAGEGLEALEKELKSKKFFGGEEIGFVDIVGTVVAGWLPAIEECFGFELLTTNNFPNLIKWREELVNHAIVKQFLPPNDEIVAFIQANWKLSN
ncbi:probable glutathione S-transferase [Benincasa hispida]|uniref:probable glutathione S-transferase n=1 Tax=Benincasa hispida TaxID=102211 RepID=UPI0018FFA64C|nr:probable glutathione S-transferase [Benincasa hispida]